MSEHLVTIFDTETSGFKADYHEIIDIWATQLFVEIEVAAGDGSIERLKATVLKEAGGHVALLYPNRMNPQAARVNGYNRTDWADARPFAQVWAEVEPLMRGQTMLVGSNPKFDVRFINAALLRWGLGLPLNNAHIIDTVRMADPLKQRGLVPSRKLGVLADYYGVPEGAAHTARGDVEVTKVVYFKLVLDQPWRIVA